MRLSEGLTTAGETLFGLAGSTLAVVLLFCGTIGAGLLTLFGVLFSQRAPQQMAWNVAFSSFSHELQEALSSCRRELAVANVRAFEAEAEAYRLRGELRQAEQKNASLEALLGRSGMNLELTDHTAKITKIEDID